MGTVPTEQSDSPVTMKLFVVLAFVAAAVAEPEADPYRFYSNLGYTGYHYAYTPYTRSLYGAYSYPYNTYSNLHHLGKREAEPAAEAEPTADADAGNLGYGLGYAGHYGYAAPLGYAGHHGYTGYPAYKSLGYKTLGYKTYGYPYHTGYSYYRGKREAEAEPEPYHAYNRNFYNPYTAYTGYRYSNVGYSAYPHTYGYNRYSYA